MSRVKGEADCDAAFSSAEAHAIGTLDLIRVFISPALAAQTFGAGQRFSFAAGYHDSSSAEDWHLHGFAYLWRPSVGIVAALAGDGTDRAGICGSSTPCAGLKPIWYDSLTANTEVVFPALTADIEVRLRDRIVFEAWAHYWGEGPAASHASSLHFDGCDDTHDDGDIVDPPDCASYIEYSGELLLAEDVIMNSANILIGARDLAVDGANVGALDGGATVTYEPSHVEHTVDQRMGVQRVDKIAERMTIACNLKEATLENLRIAWGQPTYALSTAGAKTTLHVGGEGAVTEHSLVLTGKAPGSDRTRTITCHKAVAIETSAHSYTKDNATVYPVTFVLVEDSTKAAGFKYMTIEDDEGQFSFA
jgi:hypothetical protein